MAQERAAFSILDGARFSLEQVQYLSSIDENRPLGIETDEVQKFLFYWDQVFLYGLKSVKKGYWAFVSAISHPSLINEVSSMPGAVNDLLRSRLWLGSILNDNELENYLTIIQYEPKLLAKYYRPYAILRRKSQLEDLISIACGQENTLFSIHLDYICFRSSQLFVSSNDSSSFSKLFDIRYNWEESVRSRSSSCVSSYSTGGSLPRRGNSYGNYSQLAGCQGSTPVGDLAITADILEESVKRLSVHQAQEGYIQYSPSLLASTVSPLSTSPLPPSTLQVDEITEEAGIRTEEEVDVKREEGMVVHDVILSPDKNASLRSTKTEVGQLISADSPAQSPVHQVAVWPDRDIVAQSPQSSQHCASNLSDATFEPLSLSSKSSANQTPVGTPKSHNIIRIGTPISINSSISHVGTPPSHAGTPKSLVGTPDITPARRVSTRASYEVSKREVTPASSPRGSPKVTSFASISSPALDSDTDSPHASPLAVDELLLNIEPRENVDTDPDLPSIIKEQSSDVFSTDEQCYESNDDLNDDLYSDTEADDPYTGDEEQDFAASPPQEEPVLRDLDTTQEPPCSPTEFISDHTPDHAPDHTSHYASPTEDLPADIELVDDVTPLSRSPVLLLDGEYMSAIPPLHQIAESSEIFEEEPKRGSPEISHHDTSTFDTTGDTTSPDTTETDHGKAGSSPEELFPPPEIPFQMVEAEDTPLEGGQEGNCSEGDVGVESLIYSDKSLELSVEVEVPDFSSVSMNRNLGVIVPTQNQKISWNLELFQNDEDICFMYRVWLKDEAGGLEFSYCLLTTQNIHLFSPLFVLKKSIKLGKVSYGRGMNWQIITLFSASGNEETEQTDIITGCESVSRGIMEKLASNISYPVNWSLEESFSQMRLKYHIGTFLQQQRAFSLHTMDDMYYGIVSWMSLAGPPSNVMEIPISEGKMWLKEPSYVTYVWKEYYFILDKTGKLSQMDIDCAGTIKKVYGVIGSGGCKKTTRKDTSKHFAFKFISEEGTEVMLNCESALERDMWMSAISKTAMEMPQVTNEKGGFGIQCCTVVTSNFIVLVREGLKKAHNIDFARMEEVTEITWSPHDEFCVVKIEKKEWLLLFRDDYEKSKFMECVWERWSEIFQCVDLKLLFKKTYSCEFEESALRRYRSHLSGGDADNTEFECV